MTRIIMICPDFTLKYHKLKKICPKWEFRPSGGKSAPDGANAPPDGGRTAPSGEKVAPLGGRVPPVGGEPAPVGAKTPPNGEEVPPLGGRDKSYGSCTCCSGRWGLSAYVVCAATGCWGVRGGGAGDMVKNTMFEAEDY